VAYVSVLVIDHFHQVLLVFLHGAQRSVLLLLLLKHPEHLLLCSSQLVLQVLVLPLHLEHSLCHFLWRVPYHLIDVNDSLDVFGLGTEIQGLLGLLVVLVQLAHRADDGSHGAARESLLQDTGKLGVAVVYEGGGQGLRTALSYVIRIDIEFQAKHLNNSG
jgi:hypothetical protein